MKIKNFNNIKESFSFYGGNAGNKKSFVKENGENWFLKFPKTTKYFNNVDISYTTSPLSEYIGSQIYKELGFPVHETELGVKDNKVVVACKNFIPKNNELFELEKVFNDDLGEFEKERENLKGNSEVKYYREIEEINFVLNKNKNINQFPEIKERFWDMFLVDAFINNNDRHLGNWGLLVDNEKNIIKLAPI
ncbi:MAG: HipA domain-containing protein, partial [Fusobacterium sp.]|nr:HipA domain-containing protein [Fusobacterium sp.]